MQSRLPARWLGWLKFCALAWLAQAPALASPKESLLAYVGGYTGKESHGIYLSRFDPETGRLSTPELAVEAENPSFLAVHPRRRFLYAVGEINEFGGNLPEASARFKSRTRPAR